MGGSGQVCAKASTADLGALQYRIAERAEGRRVLLSTNGCTEAARS